MSRYECEQWDEGLYHRYRSREGGNCLICRRSLKRLAGVDRLAGFFIRVARRYSND